MDAALKQKIQVLLEDCNTAIGRVAAGDHGRLRERRVCALFPLRTE
jgi:hypothetical protein